MPLIASRETFWNINARIKNSKETNLNPPADRRISAGRRVLLFTKSQGIVLGEKALDFCF